MALALAACASNGPQLADIEDECHAGMRPFVDTWPCVRVGFTGDAGNENDLKAVYIATGDAVAEKVRAGTMTDAEAKLTMAETRQRMYERSLARSQSGAMTRATVLSGMKPYTPPPVATSPTQTVVMPSGRMVNCTTTGTMTNCY
jgi:hypothetical protein